jgi:hypothetical protein
VKISKPESKLARQPKEFQSRPRCIGNRAHQQTGALACAVGSGKLRFTSVAAARQQLAVIVERRREVKGGSPASSIVRARPSVTAFLQELATLETAIS